MKRVVCVVVPVALCVLLVSLLAGVCGCEKNDGDGIRFLEVSPSSAVVGTNITWFTITVIDGTRELSFPLTWETQNDLIGFIRQPSAGLSALYERTPNNGVNIVTVRDQYGVEGYCHVNQVGYSTAEPITTTPTDTTNTAATTTF